MHKRQVEVNEGSEPADRLSARAGDAARPPQDLLATAAALGAIGAGVALFEAALLPGLAIGAAAVLAPKYLPKLRRRLKPLFNAGVRRRTAPAVLLNGDAPTAAPSGFAIKRALGKTITFRIIVTSLDLTWNYIVLGELAAAAGLSAISLVVGPVFYFVHETAWNGYGPSIMRRIGLWRASVEPALQPSDAEAPPAGGARFTIDPALAKTITFRTLATTMEFTTNFVVVRDLGTAAALTAFGLVAGPFVYLGHEKAWDYFAPPEADAVDPAEPKKLGPAPA